MQVQSHDSDAQVSAKKPKAVAVDAQDKDIYGGGSEASSAGASPGDNGGGQHGGKKAVELAGGLTVVIPPLGSGAVVGHLRSPSEVMLDDIAESLADTTRKPSFARMQSVQVTVVGMMLARVLACLLAPIWFWCCLPYVHAYFEVHV